MKIVIGLLLLFLSLGVYSQSVLPFRADTVKVYKVGGYAELIIANRTKDTLGMAFNVGGGLIQFKRPYKINDSTFVIGIDTISVGGSGGGGVSAAYVTQAIADAVALLPVNFDPYFFNGDGSTGSHWTLDSAVIETKSHAYVLWDSLVAMIEAIDPSGVAGGKTTLFNSLLGDTLSVKVNDSLWRIKTIIPGTNVTFTKTDTTVTINGISGTAEVNTVSFALTTTGNRTVAANSMIHYILVKPAASLTGFKIGTLADDVFFFPATPVIADGTFVVFDLGAHILTSTAVYFAGITSTTDIKIITKPLHE